MGKETIEGAPNITDTDTNTHKDNRGLHTNITDTDTDYT